MRAQQKLRSVAQLEDATNKGAHGGTDRHHDESPCVAASFGHATALGCMHTYNVASPEDDEYEAWAVPPGTPEAGIIAFKVTLSSPDLLERRKFVSTNYLPRSDFPTLPPNPGWPEKRAS